MFSRFICCDLPLTMFLNSCCRMVAVCCAAWWALCCAFPQVTRCWLLPRTTTKQVLSWWTQEPGMAWGPLCVSWPPRPSSSAPLQHKQVSPRPARWKSASTCGEWDRAPPRPAGDDDPLALTEIQCRDCCWELPLDSLWAEPREIPLREVAWLRLCYSAGFRDSYLNWSAGIQFPM